MKPGTLCTIHGTYKALVIHVTPTHAEVLPLEGYQEADAGKTFTYSLHHLYTSPQNSPGVQ